VRVGDKGPERDVSRPRYVLSNIEEVNKTYLPFHKVNPNPAYGNIVHRYCCRLRREQSGVYGRCSAPAAGRDDENHEEGLDRVGTSSPPRPSV
jgi:hypothetical protein